MKSRTTSLLAAALLLGGTQTALAADIGTNAGIDVNNEATVNYSVNSISQTAQTGNTTFKVDRKVDVVVSSATVLDATPGETGKLLLFTVTNKTNDTLDFNLATVTGGDVTATGLTIYIDDASAGTLGVLDAAEALSPVTSLDDVAEDETVNLIVVADIPGTATDSQTALVHLRADALDQTGTPLSNDNAVANTVGLENVFADVQGSATATDIANDAKHSAVATLNVKSATINVSKSVSVVCETNDGTHTVDGDGVASGVTCGTDISTGGAVSLKAIPGAMLQYCIQVANNGSDDATGISISDPLAYNVTTNPNNNVSDYVYWVQDSIKVGVDCDYNAGTSTAVDDDTVDETGDEAGTYGSYNPTTKTVNAASNATLSNGDTATVMFRVLVK